MNSKYEILSPEHKPMGTFACSSSHPGAAQRIFAQGMQYLFDCYAKGAHKPATTQFDNETDLQILETLYNLTDQDHPDAMHFYFEKLSNTNELQDRYDRLYALTSQLVDLPAPEDI